MEIQKSGAFSYIDRGQGPVIVILHGLFGSLSNFERLIALSEKKYRFIMPILPLFDCEIKNAHLDFLLEYFRRFIDHLKLQDYSILGNSLGGHVALLNELNYPNETRSLILTGSSGLFENSIGNQFPKRDKETLKEKIEITFGNKSMVTSELVDELYSVISNYSKVLRIIKLAKSATRQNLTHDIEKIKTKTLLVWGEDDKITPPFVANQFYEKLENSELAWIANCGHAPMMEYPEDFSKSMIPFLDKVYLS